MRVKYFAAYRDATGRKDEDVLAPATVGTLLQGLAERYGAGVRTRLLAPGLDGLGPDAIVLVNGRNIVHLDMLETPLSEADTVSIFPIVAGG